MSLADTDSVEAAGSELKLQAGMPAEVYIDGSTQTPLQYLTAPIPATMRKAGRPMQYVGNNYDLSEFGEGYANVNR